MLKSVFVYVSRVHCSKMTRRTTYHAIPPQVEPHGPTPLTERLEEVVERIAAKREALKDAKACVFVTILTDGVPTAKASEAHKKRTHR